MRFIRRITGLERRTAPPRCPGCGEPAPCAHERERQEGKALALRILAVPAALEAALELEERLHRDGENAWRETPEQRLARIEADPALVALGEEIDRRLAEGEARRGHGDGTTSVNAGTSAAPGAATAAGCATSTSSSSSTSPAGRNGGHRARPRHPHDGRAR